MLRPRLPNAALNPPSPLHANEPDTPGAHYTDKFGDERLRAAALAHVHEHAPDAGKLRKRKRIGLSQRAWLALAVVIGFILLTKLIMPASEPPLETVPLIPRDYLNSSATDPAPFDFCPVFGPGDAIAARRGQFELLRTQLHLGTGARVQRVLMKAMAGHPVTISVLGGSVSACAGAGDDPIAPECYPARFFNWWNSVFPNPSNELTNGAVRRTDSAYYAYCAKHHLPDKSDLVILEFDAADPNDKDWLAYFELLVRSTLLRPEQPAVIILGHFSPQVQAQNGFAGPELLHNAVAQFYDIPHISTKGVVYSTYLEQPNRVRSELYTEAALANKEGHDLIADVLISYMMSQICSGWSALQGHSFSVPSLVGAGGPGTPRLLGGGGLRPEQVADQKSDEADADAFASPPSLQVPQMRLSDIPTDLHNFRESDPFCVSAADLVNPLPPSIFYGSGWAAFHPQKGAVTEDRHYWYADQPTSRLRVPVRIASGDVGIYFLQQPLDKPAGTVQCWVDDNRAGGRSLLGNAEVEEPIATLVLIDHGVSRGSHFVECIVEGEVGGPPAPFKILGIFTT